MITNIINKFKSADVELEKLLKKEEVEQDALGKTRNQIKEVEQSTVDKRKEIASAHRKVFFSPDTNYFFNLVVKISKHKNTDNVNFPEDCRDAVILIGSSICGSEDQDTNMQYYTLNQGIELRDHLCKLFPRNKFRAKKVKAKK